LPSLQLHDSPPHSDSDAEQSALLVQNHMVVVGTVVIVVDVVDVVVEVVVVVGVVVGVDVVVGVVVDVVVDMMVDRAMHSPFQQLHESPPHSDSVAEQSARLAQNHFVTGASVDVVLVVVVVVLRLVVGLCATGLPLGQREDFSGVQNGLHLAGIVAPVIIVFAAHDKHSNFALKSETEKQSQ
jgi:hypothetical protein